jgi:DNA-binding transcriptional ArsR family regulator
MKYQQLPDGSLLDRKTGEILDQSCGTFVFVPSRIKIKEDWFMTFQDALAVLAADKDLWGRPRAVLDYMMSRLNFDNYIALGQREISDGLKIHQPHVSSAIKMLVEKGILEKGPRLGKSWSYKLNPFYGWKGRVKNLKEERKKRFSVVDAGKE